MVLVGVLDLFYFIRHLFKQPCLVLHGALLQAKLNLYQKYVGSQVISNNILLYI